MTMNQQTNLFERLEKTLKTEPHFVDEHGQLKKWLILSKAQNYDQRLMELLLSEPTLKEKFFVPVNGALVFKQTLFTQFLEQKNYLPESYTSFKNKIGLTIAGQYLKQRNEIALVWPFKDCVLEGGQSKEEQSRNEIFFNEILAQDEISQLFEPKVLTKAVRFTRNGPIPFQHFQRHASINRLRALPQNTITDHLIIKGNNLLALHSIKTAFAGKIKLIYIDPPYNTGGDANSFTYNNKFNHATWLTFMKNRLEIARTLLTDDGFIAIAIDHFELGYLIVLADEIFGRENRIGIITVVNNPMGRNQAKFFSTVNDFMVVYAKQVQQAQFNSVILNEQFLKTFNHKDERGLYKLKNFIRLGGGDANLRINKPNFWYPIYVSPDLKEITLQKKEHYFEVFPVTAQGQERTWKLSAKSAQKQVAELVAKKENGRIVIYEKYRVEKGQKVPTVWSDKKYNANHQGKRLLEKIIGKKQFSFPKSLYTVLDTIKLMAGPNDIILDFFAGSGTTAHAVLKLNQEDNGKRQFILIEQLNQHIDICLERTQKVLQLENSDASFVYFELKKFNQTFIEKIQQARTGKALKQIWQQMKARSFLHYTLDAQKVDENWSQFQRLPLVQQKALLIEFLDKNQLYVNLSSMDDHDFAVSSEEKKITRDFYQLTE